MADYQPIDYRLRCHTKRTDLPADVLRDIGEAYAEITRLQQERDEAMVLIQTIAHDISVLSTRPTAIIKFTDLVDLINEWGDIARNILDKKENTDD